MKCVIPATTLTQGSFTTPGLADAQPVSQLIALDESDKKDCELIQTVTKGAGGAGDVSVHLERAMDGALSQVASSGADSYFVVEANTTASGATVILQALKCS